MSYRCGLLKDGKYAYDHSSRNRLIQQYWQITYKWLALDKANGGMFCGTHPHHSDKKGMFVRGNISYRLDNIKVHSKSAGHRRGVAKDTTVEVKTTPAHQISQTLNKLTVECMKHLFRNGHAIGKKDRPLYRLCLYLPFRQTQGFWTLVRRTCGRYYEEA